MRFEERTGAQSVLPMHQRFAEQVRSRPEAIAVVGDHDEPLTYRDLDRRASAVASRLRALGVDRGDRVILSVRRGPTLVSAWLGILKAGAAYVPVDPDYPEERRRLMVARSGATAAVVSEGALEDSDVPAVSSHLPEDDLLAPGSQPWQDVEVGLDDEAYVIFTSGSTGRPKGVSVSHRAMARMWNPNDTVIEVDPPRRVLLASSVSFDTSLFELWAALGFGGALAVPEFESSDVLQMGPFIRRHHVDLVWLTAGVFHLLADIAPESLSGVRDAFAGGDVVLPGAVRKIQAANPGIRLYNGYGPTEAATFSAVYPIPAEFGAEETVTPIGWPVPETMLYALDAGLAPVETGETGELFIGGTGVADGYVGNDDLTRERFLPDPFDPDRGRMYRTGDLVRRNTDDGPWLFVGRADTLVKIRGFRVELPEVEAYVDEIAGVKEVAAFVRETVYGDKVLIAAIVGEVEPSRVVEQLRGRVPSYMVPAEIYSIDHMPLNVSGKVDRIRVKAEYLQRIGDAAETDAGRTGGTASVVRDAAVEILGRSVSDVEDLFDHGLDSILAARLTARLRRDLRRDIPTTAIFSLRTIARLEDAVSGWERVDSIDVPALPAGDSAPAGAGQERLWTLDHLRPHSTQYNVAGYAILPRVRSTRRVAHAIETILDRHEALRTVLRMEDGNLTQVVRSPEPLMLPVYDLTGREPKAVERALEGTARTVAEQPFSLADGPLARFAAVQIDDDVALVASFHHVIIDGRSLVLFFEELARLLGGEELPPVAAQYRQFTQWQRAFSASGRAKSQLEYWKTRLRGAQPLALPTERPRGLNATPSGARLEMDAAPDVVEGLRRRAYRHGTTVFTVTLAAYQLALGRIAGQLDVCVAVPISNRARMEFDDLIGFFGNTVILRSAIEEGMTLTQYISQLHRFVLEAHENQDLPFEQVVEGIGGDRDATEHFVLRAMLAFQNTSQGLPDITGFGLTVLPGEKVVAKTDVLVSLVDSDTGFTGYMEYDSSLYSPERARGFRQVFEQCLELLAGDGDDLPTSSGSVDDELRSRGAVLPLPSSNVVELLDAAAREWPAIDAISCRGRSLDYTRLVAESRRLAAALARAGARPGDAVVLHLERGLELIVAMIAVFRAGAVLVALDPSYPRERRNQVIDACEPVLIVHAHGDPEPAHLKTDASLVAYGIEDGGAREDDDVFEPVGVDAPAYVIFTSGTTGTPKGIVMDHRALTSIAVSQAHRSRLEPGAKTLQFASQNFDIILQETFSSLIAAGSVVVLDAQSRADLVSLPALVAQEEIVRLFLPPGAFGIFCDAVEAKGVRLPALREVVCAGDRLIVTASVRSMSSANPGVRLLNQYGPSEAHVVTEYAVDPRDQGAVPIGHPLENMRVFVVDEDCVPVGVGVTGEILVSGPQLARGYLNQQELTDSRFIMTTHHGAAIRAYRTGDLGHVDEAGDLHFQGRSDSQVKIRGHRVELAEIESTLLESPSVEAAFAFVGSDDRLIAIVKTREDRSAEGPQILAELSDALPEYMIPASVHVIDVVPLLPTGKPDVTAIRAMSPASADATPVDTSSVEEPSIVRRAWMDVLSVSVVDEETNFFDHGGNSLALARLHLKLQQSYPWITMLDLFQYTTISALEAFTTRGRS